MFFGRPAACLGLRGVALEDHRVTVRVRLSFRARVRVRLTLSLTRAHVIMYMIRVRVSVRVRVRVGRALTTRGARDDVLVLALVLADE